MVACRIDAGYGSIVQLVHVSLRQIPVTGSAGAGHVTAKGHDVDFFAVSALQIVQPAAQTVGGRIAGCIMGVRRERQHGAGAFAFAALHGASHRTGSICRFLSGLETDFLALERIESDPTVRRVVIAVIGVYAAVHNGKEMDFNRRRIVDVAIPSVVIPGLGIPVGQGDPAALRRQIHAVVLKGIAADAGYRPQHRLLHCGGRQFRQHFNGEGPVMVCHNGIALSAGIRQNILAAIRYPIGINIRGIGVGAFGKRRHGQQPYQHDKRNKQGKDPFSHLTRSSNKKFDAVLYNISFAKSRRKSKNFPDLL